MKMLRAPIAHRLMLKSKIHRATLTGKALDYEGSIALDRRLMDAADLLPGEQVHVLNVNTGARLVTYVIESPAAAGTVMLNGPAARQGEVGDLLIIIAYGYCPDADARQLRPRIVHVDEWNAPVTRPGAPVPVAQAGTQRGVPSGSNEPGGSAGEARI